MIVNKKKKKTKNKNAVYVMWHLLCEFVRSAFVCLWHVTHVTHIFFFTFYMNLLMKQQRQHSNDSSWKYFCINGNSSLTYVYEFILNQLSTLCDERIWKNAKYLKILFLSSCIIIHVFLIKLLVLRKWCLFLCGCVCMNVRIRVCYEGMQMSLVIW